MNTNMTSKLLLATSLASFASVPLFAELQSPTETSLVKPTYSYDLRKEEVEGAVLVSYSIDQKGHVSDAAVIGSTNQVFEEPTLSAMRHWKFNPAQKDGHPVSVMAVRLVTFSGNWNTPETSTAALVSNMKFKQGSGYTVAELHKLIPALSVSRLAKSN